METNQYVAAVDLGTTKVAIAVGRKAEKNKVEILALKEIASEGVIKGDLKNIEQAATAIREVKIQIENELGITINQVLVGISGQHIQCTTATGNVFVQNSDQGFSEITADDVQNLTALMHRTSIEVGKTIINVLPQIYKVDEEGDISQPVGMEGKRLEAKFNIIVGDEAAIERIRRCFARAGMQMLAPVLQPLASAEAVLSEDEKELGVAVVDIGGGTTDLCIYYDKIIRHIAVIPIGGNIINKDIRSYGILERHVEKLKTTFGEAIAAKTPAEKFIKIPSINGQASKEIPVKKLAGIIEARMYDIIEYVKHEIEKGSAGAKLGAGIVLTGGGATLKNLDLLFKSKLEMEVRLANPTTSLTPESQEKVANPKYSTIAGIIIDAVKHGNYTDVEPTPPNTVETPTQPEPIQQAPQGYTPTQQNIYNTYDDSYAPNAQQTTHEETYPLNENYNDDQIPEEEEEETFPTVDRRKKSGLFGKLKSGIKKMMSEEEIDDEENYY